jgi:hypothetical protein
MDFLRGVFSRRKMEILGADTLPEKTLGFYTPQFMLKHASRKNQISMCEYRSAQ